MCIMRVMHVHHVCVTYVGLAKNVYDRIFSDSPAKNTMYILFIYLVLVNPTRKCIMRVMHVHHV